MSSGSFGIRMITLDCQDPSRLAAFWSAATGCPVVADYGEFLVVGSTPALGFQHSDEPTPGKNRMHIDGGGGDRRQLIERLCALGASEQETHSMPGLTWTVMLDPEGSSFCVADPED